jgi:hypothetical protein
MLIVERDEYIVGIFADGLAAGDYLSAMPFGLECVIRSIDLHYPFYIVETMETRAGDLTHSFVLLQQRHVAVEMAEFYVDSILYTIERDFRPSVPWSDEMSSLPHEQTE